MFYNVYYLSIKYSKGLPLCYGHTQCGHINFQSSSAHFVITGFHYIALCGASQALQTPIFFNIFFFITHYWSTNWTQDAPLHAFYTVLSNPASQITNLRERIQNTAQVSIYLFLNGVPTKYEFWYPLQAEINSVFSSDLSCTSWDHIISSEKWKGKSEFKRMWLQSCKYGYIINYTSDWLAHIIRQNYCEAKNVIGLSLTPKLPDLSSKVKIICFPFTKNTLFKPTWIIFLHLGVIWHF